MKCVWICSDCYDDDDDVVDPMNNPVVKVVEDIIMK